MVEELKKEELKENLSCIICDNKKLKNLGKIKNLNVNKNLNNFFNLIQCSGCNHCNLSLIPSQKYLDQLYRDGSNFVFGYSDDEILTKKKFEEKKLESVEPNYMHWIYKYLENYDPGKYFEVGPGNCILFKTFKSKNWSCEAYELQSWVVAEGIFNDFDKIPTSNKDIMVLHDVLEHVSNPVAFLKRFSKFQKNSDLLFLAFPNVSSFRFKIFKTKWRMIEPLAHINFFSKKSTKKLLEKCGYEPVIIRPVSFVIFRKLLKSILRLPITILFDLLKLDFKLAAGRIPEIIINILDLISGDEMHVVAKKK